MVGTLPVPPGCPLCYPRDPGGKGSGSGDSLTCKWVEGLVGLSGPGQSPLLRASQAKSVCKWWRGRGGGDL